MLLKKDLKKILDVLEREDTVHFSIDNNEITIRTFDESSKAIISTSVYSGDNFIPFSVRKCAQNLSFKDHAGIKTSLSIDENRFQISLLYLEDTESLLRRDFNHVIHEFTEVADRWRARLDENDRNDLVYVRVKP